MRSRWQEWVIVLSILGLFGAGTWTLWGDDILRLFRPGEAEKPSPEAPAAQPVTPPAGPAAGPF